MSEPQPAIVNPALKVHDTLRKHILVDGYDLVFDLENSHGVRMVDQRTGEEYLDFFSCFASSPIGYNHPRLRAASETLGALAVNKPTNSDVYTTAMADYVETFSRIGIPEEMPHLFLIDGGALAVENALKASFDWKAKKNRADGIGAEIGRKVIHFREAFHGRTGYTMSLTNTDPVKTDLFPKFDWPRIDNPKIRFPLTENEVQRVERAERKSISQIKKAIESNPNDIAAIIIEPIQAEGGDNHFRGEFLRALRRIADEADIMLIFDEVQTGVGLTGKFWAYEHFDVPPDMITFGKKMQVCGFLCGRRIDEVDDNVFAQSSRLNSTFGGNLIDMARAQYYLEIIEDEHLVDNAKIVGEHLITELEPLESDFPDYVSNPRGRGLMAAFDLPTTDERNRIVNLLYELRLLMLKCGERSIRFRPALNITKEEVDEGIAIIRRVLGNAGR